jgi:CDP-diacylglycerol--glycerol-3-phosphate 3-phosphatidyltransferase
MNLANKITVVRIILTPIILVLLIYPSIHTRIAALTMFIIAILTDKLDGTIARKYNMVTKLGSFLDPLSDKLLINLSFIVLGFLNILGWLLVGLMVIRELLIQILRIIAEKKGQKVNAILGKVKGPLQMAVIILAMYFMIIAFGKPSLEPWMVKTLTISMIITLVVSYIGLIEFFIRNKSLFKKQRK